MEKVKTFKISFDAGVGEKCFACVCVCLCFASRRQCVQLSSGNQSAPLNIKQEVPDWARTSWRRASKAAYYRTGHVTITSWPHTHTHTQPQNCCLSFLEYLNGSTILFGDLRPLPLRVPSGSALWGSKCAAIDNLQKHAVLMSTDYSREEQSFPSSAHHTRCFTGHETGFKTPSSSRISGLPALDTDWLPSRAPASSISVASCTDADDHGWTCAAWAQGSWLIGWRHDCDKCIIEQKLGPLLLKRHLITGTWPQVWCRHVSCFSYTLCLWMFRQQQTLSANISIIVSWGISVMTFSFFTGTFLTIRGINQDKPT